VIPIQLSKVWRFLRARFTEPSGRHRSSPIGTLQVAVLGLLAVEKTMTHSPRTVNSPGTVFHWSV
jgi:hypothetical protein